MYQKIKSTQILVWSPTKWSPWTCIDYSILETMTRNHAFLYLNLKARIGQNAVGDNTLAYFL